MTKYPNQTELESSKYVTKTIMFVDMVGSTQIKYEKKWRESYRLNRLHNETIRNIVEENNGKVVNEIGDGLLCIFNNPEIATLSSIEIMKSLEKKEIETKIAIHMGRIYELELNHDEKSIKTFDIFGSAVDVAARILSLCENDEILLSSFVNYELRGRNRFDNIELIGKEVFLRGIDDPIDLYAIHWHPTKGKRDGIFITPCQHVLANIFPFTNEDAGKNLIKLINNAKNEIILFGLTRNFYATEPMLNLLNKKSQEFKIRMYLMNPESSARKIRYDLEPIEAAMEDPDRFKKKVVTPLKELKQTVDKIADPEKGLIIKFFDFYPSFAMEFIDNYCRIMLYGHMKRGTESPIFVFKSGNKYYQYFRDQINWIIKQESKMKDIMDI